MSSVMLFDSQGQPTQRFEVGAMAGNTATRYPMDVAVTPSRDLVLCNAGDFGARMALVQKGCFDVKRHRGLTPSVVWIKRSNTKVRKEKRHEDATRREGLAMYGVFCKCLVMVYVRVCCA
jgi:hypothetical protein